MIPKDFNNGIYDRLKSDAYFTQPDAVELRIQQHGFDPRKAVQDALKKRGLILMIGLPRFARNYAHASNEFIITTAVEVFENPKVNADAADELGRDAYTCMWKAFALLHNYTIPFSKDGERVDPFSKLDIENGGYLGEREGVPVFGFTLQSRIYINLLAKCLGDDHGFALISGTGQAFELSPTSP
jgi:hypothetical protein